jgi:hypothetical protein
MNYVVLAAISTFFVKNTEASKVAEILIDPIIPKSTSYNDILTNDFMYPAWDITLKKPVFFSSQVVKQELAKPDGAESLYSMDYNQMILASATNPTYFTSSNIKYGT